MVEYRKSPNPDHHLQLPSYLSIPSPPPPAPLSTFLCASEGWGGGKCQGEGALEVVPIIFSFGGAVHASFVLWHIHLCQNEASLHWFVTSPNYKFDSLSLPISMAGGEIALSLGRSRSWNPMEAEYEGLVDMQER